MVKEIDRVNYRNYRNNDPASHRRGFLMRARIIGTLYRFRILSYDAESGIGNLKGALQRKNLMTWLYQDSDDD